MAVNEVTPIPAEHKLQVGGAGEVPETAAVRFLTPTPHQVQQGEAEAAATFILGDEDHTLGNAVRHVIMQTEGTEFCGYSIPHPSEPYVHIRVQTDGSTGAADQFRAGLVELAQSCDILDQKLDAAVATHQAQGQGR